MMWTPGGEVEIASPLSRLVLRQEASSLRLLYLERGVDMVARWGSLLGKKHGVSMVHYGKSIGKSIGQLMTKEHDRLDWEDEKPCETMIIMCISEKSKFYQSRE